MDGVVNQLFCCILCQESVQKSWIVSCFAGCQLAIKVGTRVVDLLGAAIKKDLNQGMEGWLFEMLFFAMIRTGGGHLVQKESSAEIVWDESPVNILDPSANDLLQQKVWQKSAKRNQGGYDAVYVINEKRKRLVQVTCRSKHSFKSQYFAQLLHDLKDSDSFSHIEIIFVVFSKVLRFLM